MIRVDLRSDTVTHPSPEMRKAMYEAELGDDVYGDDPTVNRLQERAAEKLGKEAGVFVSSGTQGNLVSLLAHCGRGDGVVVGDRSHIYLNEAGGASTLGGLVLKPVPNDDDGSLDPNAVRAAPEPGNYHKPPISLLCIENSQNQCGGVVLSLSDTENAVALAGELGVAVHLDGARIFNASVYLGCEPAELAAGSDSVTFCLSKGLSCPIGSVVCGSREFVEEADRWRKMLGGGMRQVGVVAAAGLVALDSMIDRMAEDHSNARKLAEGMADLPGVDVDLNTVQTNIIRFSVTPGTGRRFAASLREEGVALNPADTSLRVVTHYGIDAEDVDYTLLAMQRVLEPVAV